MLRCEHCGDVIGIYEPLIVLTDREARETSRAADPDLHTSHGEHYHRACYALHVDEDPATHWVVTRTRLGGSP